MSILYKIAERVDEFIHEHPKSNINYPHAASPNVPGDLVKPLNPLIGR